MHAVALLQHVGIRSEPSDRHLPSIAAGGISNDQIERDRGDEPRGLGKLIVQLAGPPARRIRPATSVRFGRPGVVRTRRRGRATRINTNPRPTDDARRRLEVAMSVSSRAAARPDRQSARATRLAVFDRRFEVDGRRGRHLRGRLTTSPNAPSALCSHSSTTVRAKFGSMQLRHRQQQRWRQGHAIDLINVASDLPAARGRRAARQASSRAHSMRVGHIGSRPPNSCAASASSALRDLVAQGRGAYASDRRIRRRPARRIALPLQHAPPPVVRQTAEIDQLRKRQRVHAASTPGRPLTGAAGSKGRRPDRYRSRRHSPLIAGRSA